MQNKLNEKTKEEIQNFYEYTPTTKNDKAKEITLSPNETEKYNEAKKRFRILAKNVKKIIESIELYKLKKIDIERCIQKSRELRTDQGNLCQTIIDDDSHIVIAKWKCKIQFWIKDKKINFIYNNSSDKNNPYPIIFSAEELEWNKVTEEFEWEWNDNNINEYTSFLRQADRDIHRLRYKVTQYNKISWRIWAIGSRITWYVKEILKK